MGVQSESSLCSFCRNTTCLRPPEGMLSQNLALTFYRFTACTPQHLGVELVTKMEFSFISIPFCISLLLLQKHYTQLTSFTMILLSPSTPDTFNNEVTNFLSWFKRSLQEKTLKYSSTRFANRTTRKMLYMQP